MHKEFNITGLCIPEKHFMVDISEKIKMIMDLVARGKYFTINRPRQYGKTTTLYLLTKELIKNGYRVIKTSFEGMNDIFESREEFSCGILKLFARSVKMSDKELSIRLLEAQKDVNNFESLSDAISDLVENYKGKLVLLIDEVDKSSNNRIFLEFLGVLRNKYLAREADDDITFHSVILAGVHDIKNLKLAIRDHSEQCFNSPWNIAEEFLLDMSFSSDEIKTMLVDYSKYSGVGFDNTAIAEEIYRHTSGYPYLVSRICKLIDEQQEQNWSIPGVIDAIKIILNEKSTLFDDVIKNIQNNDDIRDIIYKLLVKGSVLSYNYDVYEKGIIYGFFGNKNGKLKMHNKIFEERIYNYLIEDSSLNEMAEKLTQVSVNQFINQDGLDMEKVLLKFKEFMYEEYKEEDVKFYETHGRMLFLSFLKPILNGRGFRFVEPVTRLNKRMDLILTFDDKQYVVELKIWNGKRYEEKGIDQLCDYLEIQRQDIGYLIVFNFNKSKEYSSKWIEVAGKKIFEVVV